MIATPPYLNKGDVIGIVCPSGFMPVEKASECIRVLNEEWGFQTKVGKTVGMNLIIFQEQMKNAD
jgi:muramoyltetrapeptide carboxypeptidase